MKSDSNTEIDLLLRRHGRRKALGASGASEEAAATGTETTSAGPHMDADEMNAYAEGQLPGAMRARAIAHLADCDQCRAIVTRLTLAANVPIEDEAQATPQPGSPRSSWRTWLAALLAPPVMRYATAALVLLGVVGAGFLLLRQQKREQQQEESTLVAQNNKDAGQSPSALKPGLTEQQQQPATQTSPPASQASSNVAGAEPSPLKDSRAAQTGAGADTEAKEKDKVSGPRSAEEEVTRTDAPVGAAPQPPKEAAPELSARDRQRDEDAAARPTSNAPAATAAPPVTTARAQQPVEADRLRQNRKDDATSGGSLGRAGGTASTTTTTAPARESEETVAAAKSAPSGEARRRAARKPEAKTESLNARERGTDSVGEGSADTRSVGGRQFRRQGSAWVDTAYSSGQATVNVKRSSEQYRALTADEPGLRSIAEQLGGEVIVVWKGRAYRIR